MLSRKAALFGVAGAFALAMIGGKAEAGSITFVFNCTIQNTNPATCTPGASLGSLTLADSVINPNRVDVTLSIFSPTPAGATGLDNFYLNYDNSVSAVNRTFRIVSQAAVEGDHTVAGDISVGSNNQGPFETRLDLKLDPTGSGTGFFFEGSIVAFGTDSLHAESDLDVNMFNLKDADGLLYAAFNTLSSNQSQKYGATTAIINDISANAVVPVPEPATFGLLGLGLTALTLRLRRRV